MYSGLEDVMCEAVEETRATSKEYKVSLRIAAYINAINKVYATSLEGKINTS